MKKLICIFLAGAMLMLAGCSGGGDASDTSAPQQEAEETTTTTTTTPLSLLIRIYRPTTAVFLSLTSKWRQRLP